jgi:hypothetical protein
VRGKTWGAEHGKTVSLCAITVDPPIQSQETRDDRIGSLKRKPQDEEPWSLIAGRWTVRKRAANPCAVSPSDPLINVNQYVQFDRALAYGFSAP